MKESQEGGEPKTFYLIRKRIIPVCEMVIVCNIVVWCLYIFQAYNYKELLEEKEGEEGVSPVLPDCRTRHIILVVLKSKTAASTLIATPAYIYYSDG